MKSDVKDIPTNKESYDLLERVSSVSDALEFVPDSLRIVLRELFVGNSLDLKIATIGHAIVQAIRPRVLIAPLQLGLGVQMHHHFSSRYLIDTLNSLGLCSSYSEVTMFERSSAVHAVTDLDGMMSQGFIHHIADNVDHDICTIDGRNTFHGMGIIASITPAPKYLPRKIPRTSPSAADIRDAYKIRVLHVRCDDSVLSKIRYVRIPDFTALDPSASLDTLWLSSWYLKTPRPGWNGTHQTVMVGNHPGKASVIFLPMIDLSASDDTCVYSTLMFIADQAKRHGFAPVVTFDQPLWWKAMKMVEASEPGSELSAVVLKLGGFHTTMSFIGCIGYTMEGSGLREVLELAYAPNTVPHLLSGKAISRAVRGLLLVDSALHAVLLSELFDDDPCSEPETKLGTKEVADLKTLYSKLMNGEATMTEVEENPALKRIKGFVDQKILDLSQHRTSKLWFQLMNMVGILRSFIKAERMGLWDLHLKSVSEMLPFLAACGHNNYAKSCRIYLQKMVKLEETHPTVHSSFQQGMHVVRRSDRYWAGLSTDLVIEQELMRSLKTAGGLTRGTGMTETQRSLWVLARPTCSAVNLLMEDLTQILYGTSEQHKENAGPRQERDFKDTQAMVTYFENGSPFGGDTQLRSIATGLTAYESANVDCAKAVGLKILDAMTGKVAKDFVFRRKEQAVQITTKQTAGGDCKRLDPALLFQRFIALAKRTRLPESECFRYELCSYPAALFDSSFMPRVPNKAEFAKAIALACKLEEIPCVLNDGTHYVLDGGSLLHRVPWIKNDTYAGIIQSYSLYISRKYPGATVVFDGYDSGPSIKDMAHSYRNRTIGREVFFTNDMRLKVKKEEFLGNKKNKSRFISALAVHLRQKGYFVVQAPSDADVPIVKAAIESAKQKVTAVIGEDTDLLVLLCYHCDVSTNKVYFAPEPKKNKERRCWDVHEMKKRLGQEVCGLILFAHAFLGCDSTSRVHNIGKGLTLKKVIEDESFRASAKVFMKKAATKIEVKEAGEDALLIIYGGKKGGNLNELRKQLFERKLVTATAFVHPEQLPPTSNSAAFHSYRVYFQVHAWNDDRNLELDPQEWGWKDRNGTLYPVMTDLPPAPPQLLKIVKCSCRSNCTSARCTCVRNGMSCTLACKTCQGAECDNSPKSEDLIDDLDDEVSNYTASD